mgnify:FL=1
MISVIVPVFDAETTIERCIDSVMNQTYRDWELILVDDGSTDSSYEKCMSYAHRTKQIKVLRQSNSGASAARNYGIEEAVGKFLCFLDSDDFFEPTALEILLSATQNDVDFVYGGFCRTTIRENQIDSKIACVPTQGEGRIADLADIFFEDGWIHSCWGKLYKREIVSENNITFPVGMGLSEDSIFNIAYLEHASTWKSVAFAVYDYCYTTDSCSVTHRIFPNAFDWYLKLYDSLEHFLCSIYSRDRAVKVCVNTVYPQYYATIRKFCLSNSKEAFDAMSAASNNSEICRVLRNSKKGVLERIVVTLFIIKKWRAITWILNSYEQYARQKK